MFVKTQVIESQSTKEKQSRMMLLSQPSRLQQIRELSQSEENRIVDSSCDFQGDESTQELLLRVPNYTEKPLENETEEHKDDTMTEKETQVIPDDDFVRTQADESLLKPDTSLPLNNLKLNESPWENVTKDTQGSSETPWLTKIRNPFSETPMNNKFLNSLQETPNSVDRKQLSLDTPTVAHNIFQRLRENHAAPELEVETQSAPNLMFDTQTQSTPALKTQSIESDPSSSHLVRLRANSQSETAIIQTQDETQTVLIAEGSSNPRFRSAAPTQTIEYFQSSQQKETNDRDNTLGNSQPDLQVPGTAPDNDISMMDADTDQDQTEITQNLLSSPVVSDDDRSVMDLGFSEKLKNHTIADSHSNDNSYHSSRNKESSYLMAEDSILRYRRDLSGSLKEDPRNNGAQVHQYESLPQAVYSPSFTASSRIATRFASVPAKLGKEEKTASQLHVLATPARPDGLVEAQAALSTKLNKDSESSPLGVKSAQTEKLTVNIKRSDGEHFGDFAKDVTQDLSDIDDENEEDESRIENTVMEESGIIEVSKRGDDSYQDEEDDRLVMTFQGKKKSIRKRKIPQIQTNSNPKRSKSVSKADLSQEGGTSQTSFNHDITSSMSYRSTSPLSPLPSSSALPLEVLREESMELTDEDRLFKNSVWCFFNADYYPGIVLSHDPDGLFSVKFADSVDEISVLYPLDLRIGDHVQVGRSEFLVTGLKCVVKDENDEDVIRCMRGYDTVIAKRVKGRGKKRRFGDSEDSLRISDIKISADEWFKRSRLGADSELKPRRLLVKEASGPISTYKEEFMNSTPRKVDAGISSTLFADCLFVITGIENQRLIELIEKNSGVIIEDGFSSLVMLEKNSQSEVSVKAKNSLQGFKFGALISQKYSRSPKYLEALSLGWPLLSDKFILDSIEDNELKTKNLTSYLLPAGGSKRLGSVKSADIIQFANNLAAGYPLSRQIYNNKLLEGRYILLASGTPEIIKFIFYTLGAKIVKEIHVTNHSNLILQISNLDKTNIVNRKVPILLYHEKLKVLRKILTEIEPSTRYNSKRGKKSSDVVNEILKKDAAPAVKLELIDWEWVVQCLIDNCAWRSEIKTI